MVINGERGKGIQWENGRLLPTNGEGEKKKKNGKKEREGKGNEKEKNNLVKNFTHAFLHFCML